MNQNINNRRFIRFKFPYTINIYPDKKNMISTYTEDISEGGLNIVIKENLDIASVVDMEIFIKNAPISCKGKIAWIKTKENTMLEDEAITYFCTGIEFQQLTQENLDLIKSCVEKRQQEKPTENI